MSCLFFSSMHACGSDFLRHADSVSILYEFCILSIHVCTKQSSLQSSCRNQTIIGFLIYCFYIYLYNQCSSQREKCKNGSTWQRINKIVGRLKCSFWDTQQMKETPATFYVNHIDVFEWSLIYQHVLWRLAF